MMDFINMMNDSLKNLVHDDLDPKLKASLNSVVNKNHKVISSLKSKIDISSPLTSEEMAIEVEKAKVEVERNVKLFEIENGVKTNR